MMTTMDIVIKVLVVMGDFQGNGAATLMEVVPATVRKYDGYRDGQHFRLQDEYDTADKAYDVSDVLYDVADGASTVRMVYCSATRNTVVM